MAAARLALAALAVLLLVAEPAAAAAPSTARLVAVTAPPPEHLADPGLKTYVFRFGPHRIGPYQVAKDTDFVSPPPVDGAIVGMDSRLIRRSGAEVPQSEVMLHHIVYIDGGPNGRRRDGACPRRRNLPALLRHQRGAAPADAAARLRLQRSRARNRWRASWMVMNHQADQPPGTARVPRHGRHESGRRAGRAAVAERAALPREPGPAVLGPGRRRAGLDSRAARATWKLPSLAGSSPWAATCTVARTT